MNYIVALLLKKNIVSFVQVTMMYRKKAGMVEMEDNRAKGKKKSDKKKKGEDESGSDSDSSSSSDSSKKV